MEKYFLNYDDPNLESNYLRARRLIPDLKKALTNDSIHASHEICGRLSLTNKFMILDADCVLLDSFSLKKVYEQISEEPVVYIYRAINPVNDLIYGHGGIKVFDKRLFNNAQSTDFSTSFIGKIRVMDDVLNIHKFNSSGFHAWRTAFRECAKLSAGAVKNRNLETDQYRLSVWCEKANDVPYAEETLLGARAGKIFGETSSNLSLINNFEWLKEKFKEAVNVLET